MENQILVKMAIFQLNDKSEVGKRDYSVKKHYICAN